MWWAARVVVMMIKTLSVEGCVEQQAAAGGHGPGPVPLLFKICVLICSRCLQSVPLPCLPELRPAPPPFVYSLATTRCKTSRSPADPHCLHPVVYML